jgi:ABC-2 type transport system permease protein
VAVKYPTRKGSRLSQVLAGILVNSVYEMENYPVVLLNTVVSPLSFLLVIVFVSRGSLFGVAIEGGFIMAMFSAGMGLSTDLSHLKNDFKLQDMVVSSPTTAGVYVTGMAISEIVYSIPALLTLIILMGVFIHPSFVQASSLLGVMALMFFTSVTIGFTLSTFSSDVIQSFAFTGLISTLFSTLPPVYYPITYIPLPFRYLAYLSPTTYAAEIAQSTTGLLKIPTTMQILDWLVLIVLTVILGWVAVKKARWREV